MDKLATFTCDMMLAHHCRERFRAGRHTKAAQSQQHPKDGKVNRSSASLSRIFHETMGPWDVELRFSFISNLQSYTQNTSNFKCVVSGKCVVCTPKMPPASCVSKAELDFPTNKSNWNVSFHV